MCIVALAWRVLDQSSLCLISNRDEFYRRPTAALAAWLSKGQFLSLPMILVGMWMMWYAYQKKIYDWGPQKTS